MTMVTFYQLTDNEEGQEQSMLSTCSDSLKSIYKKRKWSTILCKNKKQAEAFDELVWNYHVDDFIPHNLYGEGPKQGTPAEITWEGQRVNTRHTLINLSQTMIENHRAFQHIIDFVPVDEEQKQAARERYKLYKLAGCNMQFTPANHL
ncbi:DNA polymerase III subunit chi [Glaciecola sp. MH2013]|uniref:DNA polymerase III subunit chi n=1 Tax=Glaciecola sp. MH2013 TaxID=2785524 RepID=UPI001E5C64D9|nr:DNA polymerase III subunit chi [Glaciecola sp. MH2013]